MSLASPTVLQWAGAFAQLHGARIEIVHSEWLDYPPYFLPTQTGELTASGRNNWAALLENLQKLIRDTVPAGVSTEITLLEGHPVETILKRARLGNPDLIVMGSHGRSGISRLRLGSVAENVIQQTASPTLVVRAPNGNPVSPKISRILCPVDLSEPAQRSLAVASDLAARWKAQLLVLHAGEQGMNQAALQKQLCDWIPADLRGRCELVELVRHGDPAEQILLAAREHGVDLIALAAMHRRLLDFSIIGTTTERVMRHADAPILVLPARAEASS